MTDNDLRDIERDRLIDELDRAALSFQGIEAEKVREVVGMLRHDQDELKLLRQKEKLFDSVCRDVFQE